MRYFIIPAFLPFTFFLLSEQGSNPSRIRRTNRRIENGLQPNLKSKEIVFYFQISKSGCESWHTPSEYLPF